MTRTDTERLEWISRRPEFSCEVLSDQPDDGLYIVWSEPLTNFVGNTFRAAIDAAMDNETP